VPKPLATVLACDAGLPFDGQLAKQNIRVGENFWKLECFGELNFFWKVPFFGQILLHKVHSTHRSLRGVTAVFRFLTIRQKPHRATDGTIIIKRIIYM